MWECGLKQTIFNEFGGTSLVTPYVGVWIETMSFKKSDICHIVTPYVGVWIETGL